MVVLIGIDGMGTDGFQFAATPNLDMLVRNGALSLTTRGVMPTVSAPNWASHLMGAGPEQHGVTANGWSVHDPFLLPAVSDEDGFFPSVFTAIKQERPALQTAFFYDWKNLADLFNPAFIDQAEYSGKYEETLEKAASWIVQQKPAFTFVYIGHPDGVGHRFGWESDEYLQSLEQVDEALGAFFQRMKEAGIYQKIHFLVVSDHGGVGKHHGGISLHEMETPWIISGKGVINDYVLMQPNNVFNTASTVLYLLGVPQPEGWTGTPVYGAFDPGISRSREKTSYVPQPAANLTSGIYTESMLIGFSVSDTSCLIHYTVDGSNPTQQSPLYKAPVLLLRSQQVKAAAFRNGHRSRISETAYTKVHEVTDVTLVDQADEQYPANGAASLADRILATSDFTDKGWLGFRGVDLEAVLDLGDLKDIRSVAVRFLNNEYSWIFLPEHILFEASVNGVHFLEIASAGAESINMQKTPGINTFSFDAGNIKARYIRITAKNTGVCPSGHPGEGEKAWLFTDEVIIE